MPNPYVVLLAFVEPIFAHCNRE